MNFQFSMMLTCFFIVLLTTLAAGHVIANSNDLSLSTNQIQAISVLLSKSKSTNGMSNQQELIIPGSLTKDILITAIQEEIREQIIQMADVSTSISGNDSTKSSTSRLKDRFLKSKKGDLSGLNYVLEDFTFDIPIDPIQQEILGFVATINVDGTCGDIASKAIDLDYQSESNTLQYMIDVQDIQVNCEFFVEWDTGVLDVDDELTIEVEIKSTDLDLSTTLRGAPPTSSTIDGCQVELTIASISSKGGFSADIVNELEDFILDILMAEMETISDLLCEQVGSFASTIDELLLSVSDFVQPYLIPVGPIDPLVLEKSLVVATENLVSLQKGGSELADILDVFLRNLQGVFGAHQINTLIELNLLDEYGVYVLDVTPINEEGDDQDDEKDKDKDKDKDKEKGDSDVENEDIGDTGGIGSESTETCSIGFRRNLRMVERRLIEVVQKQMTNDLEKYKEQVKHRRLQDTAPPLFTLNDFELNRIEVIGLNTFSNFDLPQVIGQYTLQSKLSIQGLQIRVTLTVDATTGNTNIREVVEGTIVVDQLDVIASYLVGLSQSVVDSFTISTFINGDSLVPCILTSLVTAGVSELNVNLDAIESPIVEGFLSSGVDELINTALEGVFESYQDLFLDAVPNIFQNNVTAAANDYISCYIRTEGTNAVCPPPPSPETQSNGLRKRKL